MFGVHLQMCTSLVRHLVLTLLEPVNLRQPNLDLCLHLWDTGTMVCTESRTPGHVTRAGVMMWSHTMSDFNIIIIMTIRDQSSLEGMIYTAACCAVVYSNVTWIEYQPHAVRLCSPSQSEPTNTSYLKTFFGALGWICLYGTILGWKSSSDVTSLTAEIELGFRAPLSSPSLPKDTASPSLLFGEHASSDQLTLSKLSVKPKEIPITTGPSDRSTEINNENLILSVGSLCPAVPLRSLSRRPNRPLDWDSSTLHRSGASRDNLRKRCSFFL